MSTEKRRESPAGFLREHSIQWEETPEGCWHCTSHSLDGVGYTQIVRNRRHYTIPQFIAIYYLKDKPSPTRVVRHLCNNRWCINPNHLQMGSKAENTLDFLIAGPRNRQEVPSPHQPNPACGENHPKAKLTVEDVKLIRWALQYMLIKEVAAAYNVSATTISYIKHGQTWRSV